MQYGPRWPWAFTKLQRPVRLSKKKSDGPLFHVPFAQNLFFTGRQDALQVIQEVLFKASQINVALITGLGGIGKTQTALEYAYRHRDDYRIVWWMEAESAAGLDRGVAELAAALRLPGADPADPARTRAALCRWMERESGWLLILDNADQPQALRGYLPPAPAGHVLITSRNPLSRKIGKMLDLELWPRQDSVEFLLRRTDCNDPDGAAALAAELGDLPLALEQAAAYVEATRRDFAGYVALYRKRFAELAGDDEFRPQEYPDTVLTTWTVSLTATERKSPIAGDLLRLLAFLAPDDIPRDLLTGYAAELPQSLAEAIADGLAFDDAVAALRRYSLIRATETGFAVHRLVQAVTRARVTDPLPWADSAIALVQAAFPKESQDVRFWLACARLRPHTEAALAAARDLATDPVVTSRLLNQLAVYLQSQSAYVAAVALLQRALAIQEKALGPEHPEVAAILNNLAGLYYAQGRYAEAEPLFQRALSIQEKAFGPEHPDVATSLNNLAGVYLAQNRYSEAEPLFQRALAIKKQAFRPEHPDVANCLNSLAMLYRAQGRYAEAEPLFQRALSIREQVLGPEHPHTAQSLHNLGGLYCTQDRWGESESLLKRALAIKKQTLGPHHLEVADSFFFLGLLYHHQGDFAKAEQY